MRILTLNLRHDADRWEERSPLIVEELAQIDPDVIAFQEVSLPIRQAHVIADKVAKALHKTYKVVVEGKWGEADPNEGIAIMTKLEVTEHKRYNLPEGGRVAQCVTLRYDRGTVNVINTHLHHLPLHSEAIREKQVRHLLGQITEFTDHKVKTILVGDFNSRPLSSTINLIKQYFVSAYHQKHGAEPQFTFPTPLIAHDGGDWFTPRTLDYIFYFPAQFDVDDARLVFTHPSPTDASLYPSDHYGLTVELRIRDLVLAS